MSRSRRRLLAVPPAVAAVVALGACGQQGIQLAENDPNYQGALLFVQRCSGCHTLEVAGTEGSTTNIATRENKDGPNFNQRQESVEDVLYAIQNGGFSSGPMPQNIVTGEEAEAVAEFVAKYSGREAERPPDPTGDAPTGTQ
jgi:mono/diheme cytochrome c family protein